MRGSHIAISLDARQTAMTSARKHTSAVNEEACHPLYQMALYKLQGGRSGRYPFTAPFPARVAPWVGGGNAASVLADSLITH